MMNIQIVAHLLKVGWSPFWTNPEGVEVRLNVNRLRVGIQPENCFLELNEAGTEVVAMYSFHNVAFRFVSPVVVQSQPNVDVPE